MIYGDLPPIIELNVSKWFLVCVDDHSQFRWLFLLKEKTEVTKILKNLCYSVKRQFGVDIQGFGTDNVRDFCNRELREFFDSEGIQHEMSCTYTPSKMALLRRK